MSANSGKFFDRLRDGASSVSGSAVNLNNSAPTGFQTFGTPFSNNDFVIAYMIADTAGNIEITYGQYLTGSPNTLSRAAVPYRSTNGGAQVASFSGTISVAMVNPADYANAFILGPPSGIGKQNYLTSSLNGIATLSQTTGRILYMPVMMDAPFMSASLKFNISAIFAGSGTVDIGLYNSVGGQIGGKYPGALLGSQTGINVGTGASAGDIATSSINMPSPQPPGLYWVGVLPKTNSPTFRVVGAGGNNYGAIEVFGNSAINTGLSVSAYQSASGKTSLDNPAAASMGSVGAGIVVMVVGSP